MGFAAEYLESEPARSEVDALKGPVLIEFGAPWCGYCMAVQASLADMLARFPDVTHIKVHDARRRPLGRSFRVKLWPNLVFLRDGKVVAQLARPGNDQILAGLTAIAVDQSTT